MKSIIVKLGGKILETPKDLDSTISQLNLLLEKKIIQNIVIIPGGGSYANFVRIIDDKLNIGDDLSHWMAIYAMNQNGKELSEKYPNMRLLSNFNEIKNCVNQFCIYLPFNFLYQNDELPHSWNVTSDSISLYLAHKLNLNEIYLIKDIDGIVDNENQLIKEISTKEYRTLRGSGRLDQFKDKKYLLKESTPIDNHILSLIEKYRIACVILNGKNSESRILEYFEKPHKENQIFSKIIYK